MAATVSTAEISSPQFPKWQRGLMCLATFCVSPIGALLPKRFFKTVSDARLDRGLVLILPGIEGRSFLNLAILHGLGDGGLNCAMEVFDWTTGNKLLTLYHLRAWQRNLRVAQQLAERIVEYRNEYPGRPVWIVGHSGGGAMALLTAKALPQSCQVTGLILLAPAIQPRFDLSEVFRKVECGIWTFYSVLDCLFCGLGTTIFGTVDGGHQPAAGMVGFSPDDCSDDAVVFANSNGRPPLIQTAYHPRMIADFNFGGHFGCVNRVFISENIAPLIRDSRMES